MTESFKLIINKMSWRFNLEKSVTERKVAKTVTEDPYGSNQSIIDINVRSNTKGNMNQQEVLEAVNENAPNLCLESLGRRKSSFWPAAHDVVFLLDDGLWNLHLHNYVHAQLRYRSR